jgi:hypothetical protein
MRASSIDQERSMQATPPRLPVCTLLLAAAALAACGKAQEKASEKIVEKAIESSMSKDGTSAKVDLSQGAMKVTTTDASGKTTQMEMGNAKVSEADLGVPFYPGSTPMEGGAMRVASGDSTMLRMNLQSNDAPDKVAAFYRDKLKAMSEGKQLIDMVSPEGGSLSLMDDKSKSAIQVHVSKDDKGTTIMLSSTKGVN